MVLKILLKAHNFLGTFLGMFGVILGTFPALSLSQDKVIRCQ